MLSIVYSSRESRPFSAADLEVLLEQSRASNAQHDLTGLLMHRDGRFLQLLEGPEDAVQERMRAIEQDPRHGGIRVLLEDDVEERLFPDWTMGFEEGEPTGPRIPGFRRTFDDVDADRSTSGTLPALRALIAWYRERHDGR